MAKRLILYYSRKGKNYKNGKVVDLERGHIEMIVNHIKEMIEADVFEVKPKVEYNEDYLLCTEEAQEEARIKARPELQEYLRDIREYEEVIIAGPNWWGTYPMVIFSQIEKLDFAGKRVFPVISHEGSGVADILKDLETYCEGAEIADELVIQGYDAQSASPIISLWVDENFREPEYEV